MKSESVPLLLAMLIAIAFLAVPVSALADCGDSEPDPGEQCDDGNTTDGDGCSSTCTVVEAGFGCTQAIASVPDPNDPLVPLVPPVPSVCNLIPDAPITVSGLTKPGKIDLIWTANLVAERYNIWRGEGASGVQLTLIAVTSTPSTLFVDYDVLPATTYTYAVQTVVTGATSELSDEFEVFIPAVR